MSHEHPSHMPACVSGRPGCCLRARRSADLLFLQPHQLRQDKQFKFGMIALAKGAAHWDSTSCGEVFAIPCALGGRGAHAGLPAPSGCMAAQGPGACALVSLTRSTAAAWASIKAVRGCRGAAGAWRLSAVCVGRPPIVHLLSRTGLSGLHQFTAGTLR